MKKKFTHKNNTDYSLAHVLYQKLGNDWYAFTEVDGDCFMTKVDAAAVDQRYRETGVLPFESRAPKKRKAA